jgi:hypothetical protein
MERTTFHKAVFYSPWFIPKEKHKNKICNEAKLANFKKIVIGYISLTHNTLSRFKYYFALATKKFRANERNIRNIFVFFILGLYPPHVRLLITHSAILMDFDYYRHSYKPQPSSWPLQRWGGGGGSPVSS